MEKWLCKIGIHNWDYKYLGDPKVKWPRFHITHVIRTCRWCGCRSFSKPEDGSKRIRYERIIYR